MRIRRRLVTQTVESILKEVPHACSAQGAIDPYAIAASFGIDVRKVDLDDSLSGFLIHDESGKVFIGVNQADGERRQRFTVAHELGHYFLHDRTEPFLDGPTGKFRVMSRDELSKDGTDPREIEANLFAAELLMPTEKIRCDLESHGHFDLLDENDRFISDLAGKYMVSVRALTIRLERLGYISEI